MRWEPCRLLDSRGVAVEAAGRRHHRPGTGRSVPQRPQVASPPAVPRCCDGRAGGQGWQCLDVEGGLWHMPDMWLARVHQVRWLGQRDRGFAALRRATRGSDYPAGHVRLWRQGHRQPAAGYVRGVRVFRDAAPGRLRRSHGGTVPGAGSARRDRRCVRLPGHAGLADRVARGRFDGPGGVRRDLRRRGQLGAGRGRPRHCCWRSSCRYHWLPRRRPCPTGWPAGGWPGASRWWRRHFCGLRQRATGCVVPRPPRAGRWPPGCVRGSRTCSAGWTNSLRWIAITRLRRRTRRSRRCAVPSWRRPTARPG